MSREKPVRHAFYKSVVNSTLHPRYLCMYCNQDQEKVRNNFCDYATYLAKRLANGDFDRRLKYCERTDGDRSGTQAPTEK